MAEEDKKMHCVYHFQCCLIMGESASLMNAALVVELAALRKR